MDIVLMRLWFKQEHCTVFKSAEWLHITSFSGMVAYMSTQEKAKAQIVNFKVDLGHLWSNTLQKPFLKL